MSSRASQLDFVFHEQIYQFTNGLIAGGFIFFTLLALTVVWFLKNHLLKLLLIFTTLQTVLVSYDFQWGKFGELDSVKYIVLALFVFLVREYFLEIQRRANIKIERNKMINIVIVVNTILMIFLHEFDFHVLTGIFFVSELLYWLYLGVRITSVLRNVRVYYRISGFLLWFYSWMIFALLLFTHAKIIVSHLLLFSLLLYCGWLAVSFIGALSLIHQVVQINSDNFNLESEQLELKNKLGLVQLESSETERKRIVSELHNDVLNRIDMLSMTANQSAHNQELVNLNLSESLKVLRKYTYNLYPPHTDVLSFEDICFREAEIWSVASFEIKVQFDPLWNELKEDYKLPVFRFFEFVTKFVQQQCNVTLGRWIFSFQEQQFMIRLIFEGVGHHFTINPENYLIFTDLLNARSQQATLNEQYEISLTFNP
jgi:hypothetical protein